MAHKLNNKVTPTEVGEFYANWKPNAPVVAQFEHDEVAPDFTKVREGRPMPAGGKTSAEMAAEGWVGLYLKVAQTPPPGATKVEWFTEPAAE